MKRVFSLLMLIMLTGLVGCDTDTTKGGKKTSESEYFTVILDANDGTDRTADIKIEITGKKIKYLIPECPFDPTNDMTFLYWNDASDDSGVRYDVSDDETFQAKYGSITLYAIWKAASKGTYYIEYNANNGKDQTTDTMKIAVDQKKALKTIAECGFTPPAKNMRFVGWTTQADGSGDAYKDGQRVTNLTTKDETITLYAQWAVKTFFVITYNDDKNPNIADQTFDLTHSVTLQVPNVVTGYTFDGWYDESNDGSHISDWAAGEQTDDIELWAKWNANGYSINFEANGGTGSMANQAMTYDVTANLTENAFSRSGFRFIGWNTLSGGNGTSYSNAQSVSNLTATANGIVTLYAIWEEADTYTIIFNANGGSGTMDSVTFVIDEETALPKCIFKAPAGKIFDKWHGSDDNDYANMQIVKELAAKNQTITLTAQWKMKDYYVIVLHDELHPNTADVTFDPGNYPDELPTPSETGWTFDGWYDASTDGTQITQWTANEDTELYAHWTHITIRYAFTPNGGRWGDETEYPKEIRGYYGEPVSGLPNISRSGWVLSGWNGSVSGFSETLPTSFDETSETFAAQWAFTYKVSFDANGGTGTMEQQRLTYDVTADLPSNAFTRSGWTFYGWDVTSDGTGTAYTDGQGVKNLAEIPNSKVTLYAIWYKTAPTVGYICYDKDGTKIYSDCYLSGSTPLGVVFEVGTKTKIVYWKNVGGGLLIWCSSAAKGYASNAMSSSTDGAGNTAIVKAFDDFGAAKYPAFYNVTALGEGWYLPAMDELIAISVVYASVNQALSILGKAGLTINSFDGNYWSSTSKTEMQAYYLSHSMTQYANNKTQYEYDVRAVLAF